LGIGIGVLQCAGATSDSRLPFITFKGLEKSIYHYKDMQIYRYMFKKYNALNYIHLPI